MSTPVLQEQDRLPVHKTLVIFGITAATIVVSLVLAALFLHLATGAILQEHSSAQGILSPAPEQIAGVKQGPILLQQTGLRLAQQERERLRNYAWVNRTQGVVRIPIERAMEIIVGEANP